MATLKEELRIPLLVKFAACSEAHSRIRGHLMKMVVPNLLVATTQVAQETDLNTDMAKSPGQVKKISVRKTTKILDGRTA